jgi:hypothetical protein
VPVVVKVPAVPRDDTGEIQVQVEAPSGQFAVLDHAFTVMTSSPSPSPSSS